MDIVVNKLIIYPVKALCGVEVNELVCLPLGGGILYDRHFAMLDKNGQYINGKAFVGIHRIRLVSFKPPSTITVKYTPSQRNEKGNESKDESKDENDEKKDEKGEKEEKEEEKAVEFEESQPITFDLFNVSDKAEAEKWLSKYLRTPQVTIVFKDEDTPGFSDDPRFDGPTIVSEESLKTVESWMDIDDAWQRFRPNLIVKNAKPFWEESLVHPNASHGYVVSFTNTGKQSNESNRRLNEAMGDKRASLVAVHSVHRCVVPSRASSSNDKRGQQTPSGFIEKFMKKRVETSKLPRERLMGSTNVDYHLCTACQAISSGTISVGDTVVVESTPVSLKEIISSTRRLDAEQMRLIVNRGYAIRSVSKVTKYIANVIIDILPTAMSNVILSSSLPDSVRKATVTELSKSLLFSPLSFLTVIIVGAAMYFRH